MYENKYVNINNNEFVYRLSETLLVLMEMLTCQYDYVCYDIIDNNMFNI